MLTITVLGEENFNEQTQEFTYPEAFDLELEHSLAALSKWEQKFEKPFLGPDEKTTEEVLYYVYCMILTPNVSIEIVNQLTEQNLQTIDGYMNAKMSATWFSDTQPEAKSSEIITAELIHYWMQAANIPLEWENRHLNQLFTVIKIHGLKNAKPKKMSREEIYERNKRLNAERRAQMGSKG